jgi:hypothetical protein
MKRTDEPLLTMVSSLPRRPADPIRPPQICPPGFPTLQPFPADPLLRPRPELMDGTNDPCEELGSRAHPGYKPAFILTKAQSVKFCPGEASAGARVTANSLDASARNS